MIYFVRQSGSNYIKIGYTDSAIELRLAALQTANPRKLELLAVIDGDETTEAEYHRKYWQHKTDGGTEWFEIPASEIQGIKELCNDKHHKDTSSITGDSAFDVRQVRRRQEYKVAQPGENVPGSGSAFDDAVDKFIFSSLRGKH